MKLAIIAIVTLCAASLTQASPATVKRASGTVWKSASGGIPQPVVEGVNIKPGETLTTGLDSTVELALGTTTRTLTLAGNSVLKIERLSTDSDAIQGRLHLLRGALQASAGALSQGSKIEIQMPNGTVTALADKSEAQWSAVYDARSGNIYNLSSSDRGLALAGSLNAPTDAAKSHAITVKAGERFVMPADLPVDASLASGVSSLPANFTAVDVFSSDAADDELAAVATQRKGAATTVVGPPAKKKAKSR